MGILLGLLTALSWGSSDFLARFSARKIGSIRTTLWMQFTGLVLLTATLRWVGGWGHLFDGSGWTPWAWGVGVGCLNAFSTLCLYRSFEIGKMSVVAPISASYPALTMAISFFTGERLTALRVAGIVAILVGVVSWRGERRARLRAWKMRRERRLRECRESGLRCCRRLDLAFCFGCWGIARYRASDLRRRFG